MKRIYLILLGISVLNVLYGQDAEITYKVTNYDLNGENYDRIALESDISLTFYYCDENSLCFANNWRNNNSQSYGGVYAFQVTEFPETREQYQRVQFKFTWHYFNTYDNDSGQAVVTINNIYIGETVKFVAEILVLNTNDVITLKGYLE